MVFYSDKNVYEAAKERIHYIYDEFDGYPIVVGFSGGKDSTTVLHLTHEVAKERGIAKVPVFFLDQEVETPHTIDYMRQVMALPWVDPIWVQSFYVKPNGSSGGDFNVWGPGEEWCREKEPNNPYTDVVLKGGPKPKNEYWAFLNEILGPKNICLAGVRIQESLTRRAGLLNEKKYKDITWAKKNNSLSYTFYPIYDWGLHDVWYYIFSNRFPYNKVYNYYFSHKSLAMCRVGSYVHPRCVESLMEIREISPEFYKKALKRMANINSTIQSHDMIHEFIGELPKYFSSWDEYVCYLADNIIYNEKDINDVKKHWNYVMNKYRKFCGKWKEGIDTVERRLGVYAVSSIVDGSYDLVKMQQEENRVFRYIKEHGREIEEANR